MITRGDMFQKVSDHNSGEKLKRRTFDVETHIYIYTYVLLKSQTSYRAYLVLGPPYFERS